MLSSDYVTNAVTSIDQQLLAGGIRVRGATERSFGAVEEISGSMQRELLHSQVANLANVERVFVAAVDGIQRPELLRQLTRSAKLADPRSIQAQFVNLAIVIDIVGGI